MLIIRAGAIEDEKERFLKVATYYLSGWHIKPKGSVNPPVIFVYADDIELRSRKYQQLDMG
jgi:hypothetical protein